MYVITATTDGEQTIIHEPGSSEIKVDAAKISREKNKFASLTFDIYPENPGFYALVPFATKIVVTNIETAETVFDGRVIQPAPEMDGDGIVKYTVTCEDFMGYLVDSMQDYVEETHYSGSGSQNGLQQFLSVLLNKHNSKVEDYKKVYLGDVTLQTFETSTGVTKAISRGTTWDNISDKLLDSFGGEMRVRRGSDGKLYLDYAEHLGTTRATRIEIARNMQEASREIDFNSTITRLYPYGAKQKTTEVDENGQEVEVETEERLTIASINGGKEYIDDAEAVEKYGIIEGYAEFDDITTVQNLLTRGQEYLGQLNLIPTNHSFTALDLSYLGLDIDDFQLYDSYPCYNPLIDIDETLEITGQTIDISEPMNSTIDMGETGFRLSADIDHSSALEDDYLEFKDQISSSITNINSKTEANSASIKVFDSKIETEVNNQVTQVVTQELKNTVTGTKPQYYLSTSGTELVGGEWSDNVPEGNGYVWYRIVTTLYDGTIQNSDPVCLTQDMDAPSTVTGVCTEFYRSTSSETQEGGEWTTDPPEYLINTYLWTRVRVDYENPVSHTTSDPVLDSTWSAVSNLNSGLDDVNSAVGDINNSIADVSDELGGLAQQIVTNTETISNLVQDSTSFTFNFQQITEMITNLEGDMSTEIIERLKYIRFVDGEIWIGSEPVPGEDDYKLVISANRISFRVNNVEVAYISDDKLYIYEVQVLNRLVIGEFAFYPRDNGNMTLRYIGTGA